jgi:hypothetical protein
VVVLLTVTLVAALVPKNTAAVEVNPVPVIVTCVPPAAGPVAGLMVASVGAAFPRAGGSDLKARLSPIQTSVVLVTVLSRWGRTPFLESPPPSSRSRARRSVWSSCRRTAEPQSPWLS